MIGERASKRVQGSPTPPGAPPTVEAALEAALEIIQAHLQAEDRLPRGLDRSPSHLERQLDLTLGTDGASFAETRELLVHLLAKTPSPASSRFFNQLFGGRQPAAMMAEMLTAVANTSMYTFKVAGPCVLVERTVIRRMLDQVGFTEGEGILSPGGSLSNLMAMVVARNEADPRIREAGVTTQRLRAYTSAASHYSIRKNAGVLGLGRQHVREVSADRHGVMQVAALEAQVADDLQHGDQPFFVNATAGTTVLGAFDNLREIAALAKRFSLWLHVDAALGGSVLLSNRHRHLLDGCELADSFTWNAHKMMGVPMPCSATLLRRSGLLTRHFNETADYLFQGAEDGLNPGTMTLQCGRRNDALKLWAAWKLIGDRGFEERIDRLFELAAFAARRIDASPSLRLVHRPQSINVCFEAPGRSSAAICERLDQEGRLLVGHGSVGATSAIRLVCVNPDLHVRDIDQAIGEIEDVAASAAFSGEA